MGPGQRWYILVFQSSWRHGWITVWWFPERLAIRGGELNLQAFEKRSTATRMHAWPSDSGRSVTKSIPMWDQGQRGIGRGTSFPTGRWRGVEDMAQTEQLRTYLMTSWDILGHQYRAWSSKRIRWLPGCLEPGTLWTEPRKDCRWDGGTNVFPSAPPSGAGLVRVTALISSWMFQTIGLTMRAGGRIGSGSDGESREWRRDRVSALQLWFPGR